MKEPKIPLFVVKFNDGAGDLIILTEYMKTEDWEHMAESIRSIKVIWRTRKWYDSQVEWEG